MRLSEELARAVMAALVPRGVAAARLSVNGYVQTVPIAVNRTEEGRSTNRRLDLVRSSPDRATSPVAHRGAR